MTHIRLDIWLNIISVILALMVVHCLGRFVFTPLIPYFIQDGVLTLAQATDLASINYFGYLVGAMVAIVASSPRYTKPVILCGLLCNIIFTILQCFFVSIDLLLLLRFLNGVTNGIVFVLAPAFVLEWLHQHQQAHLSGYMYFGVSLGLVVTGLLVSYSADHFEGISRWYPVALTAFILGIICFYRLLQLKVDLPAKQTSIVTVPLFNQQTTPLFFAYFGAGLGYILPMTFLPTLAYSFDPHHSLNAHIWTIVSIACFIFTPIWNILGHRFGDHTALKLSYLLQALGVLAVFIWANHWGVVLCAILIGCSFLGSVMCTQRYARQLQPKQGIKLSACMITIYSVAQLLAPILTKYWLNAGGSLWLSFSLGLVAFLFSLLCMYSQKTLE